MSIFASTKKLKNMKNVALTLLMMLFVGVGTSMAQDKKAADSDAKATTEMSADKKHACAADCTKACCAKDAKKEHKCSASEKKACCAKKGASASADKKCAPGCEKACCSADASKAKKEEHKHDGHSHPH